MSSLCKPIRPLNLRSMKTNTLVALLLTGLIFAGILPLAASVSAQNMYEVDASSGNINEFTPGGHESTVAQIPNEYFNFTNGIAIDGSGNLYVASGPYILKYACNNGTLNSTPGGFYSANGGDATGLAFDAYGDLFEADYVSGNINEFVKTGGTLNTTPVVFASGLNAPVALAFDSAGDLCVSTMSGIYEFYHTSDGLSSSPNFVASIQSFPIALAFDNWGDLFLASAQGSEQIYELANDGGALSSTPTPFATLDSPACIAFDDAGNLYASSPLDDAIYEWVNRGGTLNSSSITFASGLANAPAELAFPPFPPAAQGVDVLYEVEGYNINKFTPTGMKSEFVNFGGDAYETNGMVFDSAGDLFVAVDDTIIEITPHGAQSTFSSDLNAPNGLAFDRAGDLFEADFGSGTINKFINTPGMGLSTSPTPFVYLPGVESLAFDSAGDLFALAGSSIVKYTYGSGALMTTPSTFASGLASLSGSGMLAFDSAGDLFAAVLTSAFSGAVYEYPVGKSRVTLSSSFVPSGLAVDSLGDVFVSYYSVGSYGPGVIYEFVYNNKTGSLDSIPAVFASGLEGPQQLAFEPLSTMTDMSRKGKFLLSVRMPSPYYSTIIQKSSDLKNWSNVYTNTPPFTYTDSMTLPWSFYRGLLNTNAY